MEISIVRTGGIMPITKRSNAVVDWTEKEMQELINIIRAEDTQGNKRDNTQYHLMYNEQAYSFDIEKIPEKYKETFEALKDNLQVVKQV